MGVNAGHAPGGIRERVLAYAALVRLPNVFTAPPDVVAGAALAAVTGGIVAGDTVAGDPMAGDPITGGTVAVVEVAGLAVASGLVYAAGTTLNDYFDADVDAEERPERPIPSGRVTRTEALALGVTLLGSGVAVAWLSTGLAGGLVAAVLAGVVVLYDGVLTGTRSGFLAMGATRGTNVVLGATAGIGATAGVGATAGAVLSASTLWLAVVPVAVTAYVAAVTWMAADEAHGTDRAAVVAVAVTAAALALLAPAVAATATDGLALPAIASLLALAFLAVVGRALAPAYRRPTPKRVGSAVGTCVLGLAVAQAAVAAAAGLAWAVGAVAFVVPAVALARAFDVS